MGDGGTLTHPLTATLCQIESKLSRRIRYPVKLYWKESTNIVRKRRERRKVLSILLLFLVLVMAQKKNSFFQRAFNSRKFASPFFKTFKKFATSNFSLNCTTFSPSPESSNIFPLSEDLVRRRRCEEKVCGGIDKKWTRLAASHLSLDKLTSQRLISRSFESTPSSLGWQIDRVRYRVKSDIFFFRGV